MHKHHGSKNEVFWGEAAPCNHIVQFYENDEIFLRNLKDFIVQGIQYGEAVIVIGTANHLAALEDAMKKEGLDIPALAADDQFIALNAEQTLAKFMVNGWPDDDKFFETVLAVLKRAKKGGRKVRAFGEMVAILWAQGHNGATVRLEHLWNRFCNTTEFCLFCAYPKSGFTQNAEASIRSIKEAHSHVIEGPQVSSINIYHSQVS